MNAAGDPVDPNPVVTATLAAPATLAGVCTTICVAVLLVTVPATPPNVTDVALLKPVPVIVTEVPPPTGPVAGETAVMVGPATKVKALVFVPVPPIVTTETLTVLAIAPFGGASAVI